MVTKAFTRKLRNQLPPHNRATLAPLAGDSAENKIAVDENKKIIYGRIVAQLGIFKDRRGQFTLQSLQEVVRLGNAAGKKGIRSRWKHPGMSDDGIGKHLGVDRNFRIDGDVVRSDFYLEPCAFVPPPDGGGTSYGDYIILTAKTSPMGLSSSLVLEYRPESETDENGLAARDESGREIPKIWIPTKIFAVDCVGDGDAVHGDFLSADDGSDNAIIGRVTAALESHFDVEKMSREAFVTRLSSFVGRLADHYFGAKTMGNEILPGGDNTESEALAALQHAQDELRANLERVQSEIALLSKPSGVESVLPGQPLPIAAGTIVTAAEPLSASIESTADVSSKIAALCVMKGRPELAASYIIEGLSVDTVKAKLDAITKLESDLTNNPTGQTAPQASQLSGEAALIAEAYDECPEVFARLGFTNRDKAIGTVELKAKNPIAMDSIPDGFIGNLDSLTAR